MVLPSIYKGRRLLKYEQLDLDEKFGILSSKMYFLVAVFCGATYAVFVLYITYKLLRFGHRDKRLPPGPQTLPILGNLHLMPSSGLHRKHVTDPYLTLEY